MVKEMPVLRRPHLPPDLPRFDRPVNGLRSDVEQAREVRHRCRSDQRCLIHPRRRTSRLRLAPVDRGSLPALVPAAHVGGVANVLRAGMISISVVAFNVPVLAPAWAGTGIGTPPQPSA